jgi:hypothetical protein
LEKVPLSANVVTKISDLDKEMIEAKEILSFDNNNGFTICTCSVKNLNVIVRTVLVLSDAYDGDFALLARLRSYMTKLDLFAFLKRNYDSTLEAKTPPRWHLI